MKKNERIYVAGHTGMVGSAIVRQLHACGYDNIITRTHNELPLDDQSRVQQFFDEERPEYVFLAAAKVGGILANDEAPADFFYQNNMISTNIIHHAWKSSCKKLLFLGSSCIYPRMAPQPIREEDLMTGSLEATNEAYALAKIGGLKYCQYIKRQYHRNFISVMPCNLYGPGDNYHPSQSHVLPAMIRRFHQAKKEEYPYVTCWGDGMPRREFLYVDDLAELCVHLMNTYDGDMPVNAGSGKDISIKELAQLVSKIVGYNGEIRWDVSKPNGTPQKLLDVSRAKDLGWTYSTELEDGIRLTYRDFLQHHTDCCSDE